MRIRQFSRQVETKVGVVFDVTVAQMYEQTASLPTLHQKMVVLIKLMNFNWLDIVYGTELKSGII